MAWVRKVRTASGATAVQIAESVAGRRRIVRHIGSAHDEATLGLLVDEANRLLASDAQGELDLGLAPRVARAALVRRPERGALFDTQDDASGAGPRWVAPPRTIRTTSDVLYNAVASIYTDLGFDDAVADAVFRDLGP